MNLIAITNAAMDVYFKFRFGTIEMTSPIKVSCIWCPKPIRFHQAVSVAKWLL